MKWFIMLILSIGASCILAGCATDRIYNAGKTIYVAGKQVVIENWDDLSNETKEKLKKLDNVATKYDKARGIIKPAIEEAKKKVVKSTSDSNKAKPYGYGVGGKEQ